MYIFKNYPLPGGGWFLETWGGGLNFRKINTLFTKKTYFFSTIILAFWTVVKKLTNKLKIQKWKNIKNCYVYKHINQKGRKSLIFYNKAVLRIGKILAFWIRILIRMQRLNINEKLKKTKFYSQNPNLNCWKQR